MVVVIGWCPSQVLAEYYSFKDIKKDANFGSYEKAILVLTQLSFLINDSRCMNHYLF